MTIADPLPPSTAELTALYSKAYEQRFGKLIRIAAVANAMLEEARDAPCDPAGCERLRDIYLRTVAELRGVLSEDLRTELAEFVTPFDGAAPTPSELRVAQAELVGWLEGLFSGIAEAVSALEQDPPTTAATMEPLPGQYL